MLINSVKNHFIEKDVYYANIENIEDQIPDITNLATNTTFNSKITEVKNKTSDITNSASTNDLPATENKVLDLVKSLVI